MAPRNPEKKKSSMFPKSFPKISVSFPKFHICRASEPKEVKQANYIVRVTPEIKDLLAENRDRLMQDVIDAMASLRVSKIDLGMGCVMSASQMAMATQTVSPTTSVGQAMLDEAGSAVQGFLEKCFEQASDRLKKAKWVKRACKILGVGIEWLIHFVKKAILNRGVLDKVVPYYGQVKGLIEGALKAWQAVTQRTIFQAMTDISEHLGQGLPQEAVRNFKGVIQKSRLVQGGAALAKIGYNAASLVAAVFSAGFSQGADLAVALIEVIFGLIRKLIRAFYFEKGVSKLQTYKENRTLPTDKEFREILSCSSYMSAVFFRLAEDNYRIAYVSFMTPALVLTDVMLANDLRAIKEAQTIADEFLQREKLPLELRSHHHLAAKLLEPLKGTVRKPSMTIPVAQSNDKSPQKAAA